MVELATGKEITRVVHQGPVLNLVWSPDGKYLATASEDNTARVVELATGKEITRVVHQGPVLNLVWSPDGKYLATASEDNTARVVELATGKEITRVVHQGPVLNLVWSPDGKYLAIASSDNTARVHWLNPDDLIKEACRRLRRNLSASTWQNYIDANLSKYELTCPQRPPHQSLLSVAANLIRNDQVKEARAILQRVQTLEAQRVQTYQDLEITPLDLNPKTKEVEQDVELVIRQITAETKVAEALKLAKKGEFDQAIALFQEAQQLDPKLERDASIWNSLCWFGSLNGYAHEVMFACDKAVALAPKDGGVIDSRGLARALTGDRQGAIADFQAFVEWTNNNQAKAWRKSWIDALKCGENPFTPEELEKLKNE